MQIRSETEDARSFAFRPRLGSRGERLRVLHVVSRLGVGGTEHGVLKVIQGLGEAGFEHRICAVRGMDLDFAGRMNVATKVSSVASERPGFQFPLFRLARVMREFRPHVVHSRNFGSLEAIPAARLARVPVAIHSEHGYELETLEGLPLRRRLFFRGCYAIADAVFTVTQDLRSYHSRQLWIPAEKLRVIHNGVDTERFSPRLEQSAGVRRQLDIPKTRVVIGSVGRLVAIKDYGTLLRAADNLARHGKDVHVLLVGSGPELLSLQDLARALPGLVGRVTFSGLSHDVSELLMAMDVFVLTSISEGMSNTILEAMASGLPAVVTRTGGNAELVEDGRSGWLFAPRDAQALVHHLLRLTEDSTLRRQTGQAARRRACEFFSVEGMLQSYGDLYWELASRRGLGKGR
jgi:sugar transferase (PEP-CTERM/EpsH1 system associated)